METMYSKLEFDVVLKQISEKAQLDKSCANLLCLQHSTDSAVVQEMLAQTAEFVSLFSAQTPFNLSGIADLDSVFTKVKQKEILEGIELNDLLSLEERILDLQNYIGETDEKRYPYLQNMVSSLTFENELATNINMKIDPTGLIFDDASSNLKKINESIKKTNQQISEYLKTFIKQKHTHLREELVTYRNNRAVVPVKAESKKAIKGIIHDESGSGQTVYIEPSTVVEYNNQLQTLDYEKKAEIEVILRDLTNQVAAILPTLHHDYQQLITLDMIKAKALYTIAIKGIIPVINNDDKLVIKQGRHPLLKKAIANDFYLADDPNNHYQTVLISGANTGGKTVALKMIGLFVLMMQSGLGVSAQEGTSLPIYDKIFVDIGDEQSIEASLSTFSSHLKNIATITKQADAHSLVLLDELGSGTDPRQGENLALAILEYLHQKHTSIVATTHYSKLKTYALSTSYVRSASVLFDETSQRPKYQIVFDTYASSNAFAIAEYLGLPSKIIKQAVSYYHNDLDTNDELMLQLQDEQLQTKALQTEYRDKIAEYETKIKEAEEKIMSSQAAAEKLITEAQADANEIVKQADEAAAAIIKKLKAEDKFVNHRVNELKADLDALYIDEATADDNQEHDFKADDMVELVKLKRQGIIKRAIGKKMYEVIVGNATMKVKGSELRYLGAPAPVEKKARQRSFKKPQVGTELNLIGLRVDEALRQLERYLDNVVLADIKQVRIIHGFGTGALRKAVHDYLSHHQQVASFTLAPYNEGGQGATIVYMK